MNLNDYIATNNEQAKQFVSKDLFDPDDECLAWKAAPQVIGSRGHNHVCRLEDQHDGDHSCVKCGDSF